MTILTQTPTTETAVPPQTGLLVAPGDVADLAQASLHLLQNEAEGVRLGVNAQREAETEHAWGRQIERLEQVYEAALGSR